MQPDVPVEIPLNEPAAQPMHAADDVAPQIFPYVPTEHAVHEVELDAAISELYRPTEQPVQTEMPVESPL